MLMIFIISLDFSKTELGLLHSQVLPEDRGQSEENHTLSFSLSVAGDVTASEISSEGNFSDKNL